MGKHLPDLGHPSIDHLDALEAHSSYIFREAFARLKKLARLWSLGKDSNVMAVRFAIAPAGNGTASSARRLARLRMRGYL
jgi:hypothetical protein